MGADHIFILTNPNIIELRNIRYIPEFEANIIAGNFLGKKGIYIDS